MSERSSYFTHSWRIKKKERYIDASDAWEPLVCTVRTVLRIAVVGLGGKDGK